MKRYSYLLGIVALLIGIGFNLFNYSPARAATGPFSTNPLKVTVSLTFETTTSSLFGDISSYAPTSDTIVIHDGSTTGPIVMVAGTGKPALSNAAAKYTVTIN